MKLVYNEYEKETIESLYNDPDFLKLFNPDEPDREYGISFKVTNPAIAQHILVCLLHNKLKDVDLGIDVTSININKIQNKDDVKIKLHQMIDDILK